MFVSIYTGEGGMEEKKIYGHKNTFKITPQDD